MEDYCGRDGLMIHDHLNCETYYDDDQTNATRFRRLNALLRDGRQKDRYTLGGYANVWKTVAVCFTEGGCQQHLDQNGHNYRHYHSTRIYVESWFRNPEMTAIIEMILEQGGVL